MLEKTQKRIDRLTLLGVWLGGCALLLSAFMVSFDVIFRKLFGITISGADEISGYVLAISTSLAFALVLKEKRNIRIDILYSFLPLKLRKVFDFLAFLALGALFLIMAKSALDLTLNTFETGQISVTPLQTPLIVPQALWFLGFVLVLLMWVIIFTRIIKALIKKDSQKYETLIGISNPKDEIESSIFVEKDSNKKQR